MASQPGNSTDSSFTYHSAFENALFKSTRQSSSPKNVTDMVSTYQKFSDKKTAQDEVASDPTLQNFTATGRPIPHPKDTAKGTAFSGLGSAESWGAGPPNLLPFRFTDDSIISVPVMGPEHSTVVANDTDPSNDDDNSNNPIKPENSKRRFSFFRRKSSTSTSSSSRQPDFVMKDMTRSQYLKHYAKDDDGNYTGTHEPAADCILNNEKDRTKIRKKFALREAMASPAAVPMVM